MSRHLQTPPQLACHKTMQPTSEQLPNNKTTFYDWSLTDDLIQFASTLDPQDLFSPVINQFRAIPISIIVGRSQRGSSRCDWYREVGVVCWIVFMRLTGGTCLTGLVVITGINRNWNGDALANITK